MLKFDLNICYPQQFCKQFHKTALFSCAERSTKLPPSFSVIIIPAVCIATVLAASALFLDYVRRSRKKGFYQLPQSAPPSAWGQPWPKRPLVHAATKCVASTHLNLWLSDFFFKMWLPCACGCCRTISQYDRWLLFQHVLCAFKHTALIFIGVTMLSQQ